MITVTTNAEFKNYTVLINPNVIAKHMTADIILKDTDKRLFFTNMKQFVSCCKLILFNSSLFVFKI